MTNRFAISRPQLNLSGDQTTIDQFSDIPQPCGFDWKAVRSDSLMSIRPNYVFSANAVGVLPVTCRKAWENAGTLA